MSLLGVYPFKVFVANMFKPGDNTNKNPNVIKKVIHYHHRTYYDNANKRYTIEGLASSPQQYSIHAGYKLGFPMYFGDESLEISLDLENGGAPGYIYYFAVGAKAGCLVTDSEGQVVPPTIPTDLGWKDDEDGMVIYYRGGIWKIDPTNNPDANIWTLKIRKYTFDPEEDDVVVGPDIPG